MGGINVLTVFEKIETENGRGNEIAANIESQELPMDTNNHQNDSLNEKENEREWNEIECYISTKNDKPSEENADDMKNIIEYSTVENFSNGNVAGGNSQEVLEENSAEKKC